MVGDPAGGLIGAAGRLGAWSAPAAIQMGLAVLQDVHRGELRAEGRALAEVEEQRRRRDELLHRLGATEVFPVGAAVLVDSDGRPDPRPAFAAVTAEELVFLDADVTNAPTDEIARTARRDIARVRVLDAPGEPVDVTAVDEVAELDRRSDPGYVVWVDRHDAEGGLAFLFRALSVAAEAARDFERSIDA